MCQTATQTLIIFTPTSTHIFQKLLFENLSSMVENHIFSFLGAVLRFEKVSILWTSDIPMKSFMKRQASDASRDKGWQLVATSDTTSGNE